jgi:penicillin-binding protein A
VIGTLAGTIRRLAIFVGILFLALLVNINLVQVTRANDLAGRPGNNRNIIKEYAKQRGPILVAGAPVAESVATDGRLKYQRRYVSGPLYAAATGFASLVYGRTAIERIEDAVLSGTDPRFSLQQIADLVAGRTTKGGSVLLTLNPKAQQAAANGMKGKVGAVVALNPTTGAILAMYSSPSFDPNPIASNDAATAQRAWAKNLADPQNPMLNRSLAQVYPPGSTFKLVTLSAALMSGLSPLDTVPGPAGYRPPGTTAVIHNESGGGCATHNGKTTLEHALQVSCNTAFAYLGVQVGADALQKQAEAYGFNHSFQVPMTAATSRFPTDLDVPQTALSAIGQYDVRATALQMAMVAAAIANNGTVMNPYLVDTLYAPDLSVLEKSEATAFGQAITPAVAQEMTDMMVNVVQHGTGTNAQIPGVRVAGKTGTAQTGNDKPAVAWFVSFAPASAPKVAVAVVVEDSPRNSEISGNGLAAPVAKAVMQAVLP